jgi:hypothetical protein
MYLSSCPQYLFCQIHVVRLFSCCEAVSIIPFSSWLRARKPHFGSHSIFFSFSAPVITSLKSDVVIRKVSICFVRHSTKVNLVNYLTMVVASEPFGSSILTATRTVALPALTTACSSPGSSVQLSPAFFIISVPFFIRVISPLSTVASA